MCQVHDLRYVSPVFEDDHVMGIETYGSMVFSSIKQILNDVHDANVSMMTLLRKQRSHAATAQPHGYMVIDMKQETPDILRLRSYIFPGEKQIAFADI
jgi:hypothetical protein